MHETTPAYNPDTDPVHGTLSGNSAARCGGWSWREPRGGEWFRTCSYCGGIHPDDLAPELVAQGPCAVCGKTGWSDCFDGQQPRWYQEAKARGELQDADGLARFDAMPAPHDYDPGGAYASWADRKYGWPHKFYVEQLANREPDRLHIIASHSDAAQGPYAPGGEMYQPIEERMPGVEWLRLDEVPDGTVTEGYRFVDEQRVKVQLGKRRTLHAKFYTIHLADPAISPETKEAIEKACGLRFTFTPGRVAWGLW